LTDSSQIFIPNTYKLFLATGMGNKLKAIKMVFITLADTNLVFGAKHQLHSAYIRYVYHVTALLNILF